MNDEMEMEMAMGFMAFAVARVCACVVVRVKTLEAVGVQACAINVLLFSGLSTRCSTKCNTGATRSHICQRLFVLF